MLWGEKSTTLAANISAPTYLEKSELLVSMATSIHPPGNKNIDC